MAAAKIKNSDNIGENLYSWVFEVAVYESLIRFEIENGGSKMAAAEMKNRDNIGKNVFSGAFGVSDYESVIRFSKLKIADSIWRPPK